jgi:3-methyladenine DNA glycosylase AlkD
MHPYLIPLQREFESVQNPAFAAGMKKYMKDQSEFYGIKAPVLRKLIKSFLKEHELPGENNLNAVIMECWSQDKREWQHVAIEILLRYIKNPDSNIIGVLEFMIINKSWWDTVDTIAAWLVGPFFKKYPDMIIPKTREWMDSGNIWLQRTCLLFQLKYKTTTDTELLFGFIRELSGLKTFWIRKAIGWALREYSKTDPDIVMEFVNSHSLAPISRKEALKVISRKK